MSLWSTFYSGDASLIEGTLIKGEFEFPREGNVREIDFSGGAVQPFLFPDDFLMITEGGKDSFWKLNEHNLIDSETHGLYRLGDSEIEELVVLNRAKLARFSDKWNEHQAKEREQILRASSIWRSREYWTINGGMSAGLVIAYMSNRASFIPLIILAGWIACAMAFGIHVERRGKQRINSGPGYQTVDWVPRFVELQSFLRQAQEAGASVYYYWSL